MARSGTNKPPTPPAATAAVVATQRSKATARMTQTEAVVASARLIVPAPGPMAADGEASRLTGILHHVPSSGALDEQAIPIDAVTAPPGVLLSPAPHGKAASLVISGLQAQGEVLVRRAERGLLTDTDDTCFNSRGERNESLAALGRPTEEPTLGHDTLNRSLHPEYRRWAERLALKISSASQKVAQ